MSTGKKPWKWKDDYPAPKKSSKVYAWRKARRMKFKTFTWKGVRYNVTDYKENKKTGKLNKKN